MDLGNRDRFEQFADDIFGRSPATGDDAMDEHVGSDALDVIGQDEIASLEKS